MMQIDIAMLDIYNSSPICLTLDRLQLENQFWYCTNHAIY